jgi:hypothetical protein
LGRAGCRIGPHTAVKRRPLDIVFNKMLDNENKK